MGIGISLFLLAVGAVLAFAVHAVTDVANIQTIGIILMAVGALGLLIDLAIFAPRRRSPVYDDAYGPDEVVETRRRARL
jgi:uncharacterized YccA/Bax inhibitor family protein